MHDHSTNSDTLFISAADQYARCKSQIQLAKKKGPPYARKLIRTLIKQLMPFAKSLQRLTPERAGNARVVRTVAGGIELTEFRDAIDYQLIRSAKRSLAGAYGTLANAPVGVRDAIDKMVLWYRLPWNSDQDDPLLLSGACGMGNSIPSWFIEEAGWVVEALEEYCASGKGKRLSRSRVPRTNELSKTIQTRIVDYDKRFGGSCREIAKQLTANGIPVSHSTVGRVLKRAGRSRGKPSRSTSGKWDRDAVSEAPPDMSNLDAFTMPDDDSE